MTALFGDTQSWLTDVFGLLPSDQRPKLLKIYAARFEETALFGETNRPFWGDAVHSLRRPACPVSGDEPPNLGRRNQRDEGDIPSCDQAFTRRANLLDKIYLLL